MKKPNFFILGAPKCGTTSLAHWLSQHPRVFMSDPKEPHYFNSDSQRHHCTTLEHYESLFAEADEQQHIAVGEASVWYLISDTAVDNILEYSPDAKFIVCIRNPVEAAVSLHDQKRFSGDETIEDFAEAWAAQAGRSSGRIKIPSVCKDPRELMYGASFRFGELLSGLINKVGTSKVLVTIMDDMQQRPEWLFQEVERYLGLPHCETVDFRPVNAAKRRKIHWLGVLHNRAMSFKQKIGMKTNLGIAAVVNRWNREERRRQGISPELRNDLVEFFRDDVASLESLLNRDLSAWLRP